MYVFFEYERSFLCGVWCTNGKTLWISENNSFFGYLWLFCSVICDVFILLFLYTIFFLQIVSVAEIMQKNMLIELFYQHNYVSIRK